MNTLHDTTIDYISSISVNHSTLLEKPNTTNESSINSQTIKTQNRCKSCNKKLGLLPFSCRCGGIFCGEHRGDSSHNCSYDYQKEFKKSLSTNLVKVVDKKIDSI